MGALTLFLECGYVPHKIEENILIPIYKDEVRTGMDREKYAEQLYHRRGEPRNHKRKLDYVLRVAVPEIVGKPTGVSFTLATAAVCADVSDSGVPCPSV